MVMENTSHSNKNQEPLPESGKYTLEQWADFLQIEPKTLKQKLADFSIRIIPFGAMKFVDAEWFWNDLLKSGEILKDE